MAPHPESNESPSWLISETRVYNIFSLLDCCLNIYYEGIPNLTSFFVSTRVLLSQLPLWKRILKTVVGSFICLETVNVDFIDSEPSDEQF